MLSYYVKHAIERSQIELSEGSEPGQLAMATHAFGDWFFPSVILLGFILGLLREIDSMAQAQEREAFVGLARAIPSYLAREPLEGRSPSRRIVSAKSECRNDSWCGSVDARAETLIK